MNIATKVSADFMRYEFTAPGDLLMEENNHFIGVHTVMIAITPRIAVAAPRAARQSCMGFRRHDAGRRQRLRTGSSYADTPYRSPAAHGRQKRPAFAPHLEDCMPTMSEARAMKKTEGIMRLATPSLCWRRLPTCQAQAAAIPSGPED